MLHFRMLHASFRLTWSVGGVSTALSYGLSGVALRRVTITIGLYSVRLSEGSDPAAPWVRYSGAAWYTSIERCAAPCIIKPDVSPCPGSWGGTAKGWLKPPPLLQQRRQPPELNRREDTIVGIWPGSTELHCSAIPTNGEILTGM